MKIIRECTAEEIDELYNELSRPNSDLSLAIKNCTCPNCEDGWLFPTWNIDKPEPPFNWKCNKCGFVRIETFDGKD